ncbi:nucleotidyltransferase domain-containing protein [Desulfoscipio sp. XC116]|uniref:type VII toxin-antitoxin system MntA family adenylyltransferase antitoxin n=1 Tax=Desulfoscipio sp. XC116 TaxID=3144975 RepID=UPI00325B890A
MKPPFCTLNEARGLEIIMNVTFTEEIKNIIDTVITYFADKENVLAVYLFGSAAKKLMRKNSDIDIAVLLDKKLNDKIERLDFILTSAMELEKKTSRPFDVVDVTAAPPALQHQILKTAQLLVENDRSSRINFEVDSRRKYYDLLPLYQARDRNVLQKFRR